MRALRQMLCKEVPRKNDSSFWIYKFLLIWVSKWIKESQENRSSGSPVCSCVLFPLSSRSSFLTSYLFACAHILSSFPAVLFPDKLLEKSSLSLGAPFACLICSAPAFCPLVLCSLKHTAGRPLHAKASGHAQSLVKCEHAQRLPECVTSLFPSQTAASLVSLKPVSLKLVFWLSYALLSLRTALRCRIHSCP